MSSLLSVQVQQSHRRLHCTTTLACEVMEDWLSIVCLEILRTVLSMVNLTCIGLTWLREGSRKSTIWVETTPNSMDYTTWRFHRRMVTSSLGLKSAALVALLELTPSNVGVTD